MIERHEERVDNDAQRDEELDERVVDEKADELLELDPVRRAVPHAANVQILERKGQQPLLDLGTFIFLVGICRRVQRGQKKKNKSNPRNRQSIIERSVDNTLRASINQHVNKNFIFFLNKKV